MQEESDPLLEKLIANALARFDAGLRAALPRTAARLLELLRDVPTRPEHAFGRRAFPHILLPYWLSPAPARQDDADFHTDVIYSTVNGYYSIRLCDDIADEDNSPTLAVFAPFASYFDSQFIRPYTRYFPDGHEFWDLFDRFWAQQAEASVEDRISADVDENAFASLSSKKFTASKIPIAAVRFRYPDLANAFEAWLRFVDHLGSFAQFSNDFFDWRHDSTHGIVTYVTSEARRRAPAGQTAAWFLRDGFDWCVAELKSRFDIVRVEAEALGNPSVVEWTIARGQTLDGDIDKLRSGLELVKAFGRITSGSRF
jgi:hypothetical protein